MSDETDQLRSELRTALDRISALEARLDGTQPGVDHVGPRPEVEVDHAATTPSTFDRRRLLTRGGTAAAGAVLGGVAATIATASPAAAASGSFDTSTSTPAVTATTTGTGAAVSAAAGTNGPGLLATGAFQPAIRATNSGGTAVEVSGRSNFTGYTTFANPPTSGPAIEIVATQQQEYPEVGVKTSGTFTGLFAEGTQWGALAQGDLVGAVVIGGVDGHGLIASGRAAQILLARGDQHIPDPSMPEPPDSGRAHQVGELYWSDGNVLWLCLADGTPGTWTRLGGTGTAGAFTVLATPTRVYDTRANSGLPGAGTGPVTGVRHDIDLTANNTGLPADATAVLVTLTVTNTVANPNAYGQIFANGLVTPPSTSSINWTAADSLVATTTTTALTAGKVAISMNPGANVLIDVLGYYR